MHSSTADIVRIVTRRQGLLETLAERPRRKRELVDRLECSRSTIDRAIRELEQFEFVARDESGYRLTVTGRLVLSEYRRCTGAFDAIDGGSELLRHVPRDAPMSTALLEDARTYEPKPHAPLEPLQELVDRFESATHVRGFAAAERIPETRAQLYEQTVENGLDVEAIFTEDLAAFLFAEYPDQARAVVTDGDFDMYATESIPYELTIVEEPDESHVFVFVLNERTEIQGVIRNDTRAALEWAHAVFRHFRSTATAVAPPERE